MHDTKERLSQLWLFALLNYLYADVLALFDIVALLGSAVLMEIPIAMILASRLRPFRANRLANIIAGAIETLAVISMQFVYPFASGAWHEHMFASYIFFGTIETVCTSVIIWKAWAWSGVETVRAS
jgi:predicted membrane-bound spermidine synthase